jgi:hypothetical protein
LSPYYQGGVAGFIPEKNPPQVRLLPLPARAELNSREHLGALVTDGICNRLYLKSGSQPPCVAAQ